MSDAHIIDLAVSRYCRPTTEGTLVIVVQALLQHEQQKRGCAVDGSVIDALVVEIGNLISASPYQTLGAAFELRRRFAITEQQTECDWSDTSDRSDGQSCDGPDGGQ